MAVPKQSKVSRTTNRPARPVNRGTQRPFPAKTTRATKSKKR